MTQKPLAVVYLRRSLQDGQAHSFERQMRDVRDAFESQYAISEALTVEEPETGTVPAEERDGFVRAISLGRQHGAAAFLVSELSRVSRAGVYDSHRVLRLIDEAGMAFGSAAPQERRLFDPTMEPFVRDIVLTVIAGANEQEVRAIQQRVRSGMKNRVRSGKWGGGLAPLGYIHERDRLVPDERPVDGISPAAPDAVRTWSGVVKYVFAELADGALSTRVAENLNAWGVPSVPPEKRTHKNVSYTWTSGRVRKIISSVVYLGVIEWGARNFKTARRKRASLLKRNLDPQRIGEEMQKWHAENRADIIRIEDSHEALVTSEVWDRANRIRKSRSNMGRSAKKREYALNGVMRCRCGRAYSGGAVKGNTVTAKAWTYECTASSSKTDAGRCIHSPVLDVTVVDRAVVDLVLERLFEPDLLSELEQAAASAAPIHPELLRLEIKHLEEERKATVAQEVALLTARDSWSEDAIQQAGRILTAQAATLADRIERLRRDLIQVEGEHERFSNARQWVADMRRRFTDAQASGDISLMGELVRTMVARIEVCPSMGDSNTCVQGYSPRVKGGSRRDSACRECRPTVRVFLRYSSPPSRVFEILGQRETISVESLGTDDSESDLGQVGHKTVRVHVRVGTWAMHTRHAPAPLHPRIAISSG